MERLREEAISKLDKPLEKMRIKELKQLLQVAHVAEEYQAPRAKLQERLIDSRQERGVACKACSEKAQLVQTVRENIHLPAKKEHLNKFANMPSQVEDEEVKTILEQIKKKQAEEQKLKDMLKVRILSGRARSVCYSSACSALLRQSRV